MKKINLLLIAISLTTLLACTNPSTTKAEQDTTAASRSIDSIITAGTTESKAPKEPSTVTTPLLESFKKVPAEIRGCGCYFSANEEQYKQNMYVFVAGYDSVAFISVDNKMIRLKMLSSTRHPATFGDYDHAEVYAADQYKLTVDIKYKKSTGEETWQNEGTLTLETKDGKKKIQAFIGECGC